MKQLVMTIALASLLMTAVAVPVLAQDTTIGGNLIEVGKQAGFDEQTAEWENPWARVVSNGIIIVFSIVGILFLILTIYAGIQWMTAGGNDEQVSKARQLLRNAVIGLLIVIMSYVITTFVTRTIILISSPS